MKTIPLFSCLYGSALYGTQTPTSDRDEKTIVLPSLDDILLGKRLENKVKKTNKERNVRNSVDDVDQEFIPLQVFARDFMMGQTYALELAFAVDGNHAEQNIYDYKWTYAPFVDSCKISNFHVFVTELREKFLTSNIKAMMGYVVNQASLYSFKGERLNAVREFKAILEQLIADDWGEYKLSEVIDRDFSAIVDEFTNDITNLEAKYSKYFKVSEYDIGGGRMAPCFKLLEKTLPFTSTLAHTITVVKALESKYGSRADQASQDNVDWKATMHALRIVDEGLMLLNHHLLDFPFSPEYVKRLLSIKRGEMPLAFIRDELAMKLDYLKDLEKTTTLPPLSPELTEKFEAWLLSWLYKFYDLDLK